MSGGDGALIVLEGAEGVGKTTQLRRLATTLSDAGIRTTSVREPGGTALGERIREILLDPDLAIRAGAEALLFLASRAQLVADCIRPALDRGEVVLVDRFFLSTYAYQVAGRGLDEGDVRAANQLAVGGLVPTLTVVLEMPVGDGLARAAARGAQDRMQLADLQFHQRVATAFATFSTEAWQLSHRECGPIVGVDARGAEAEVAAHVAAAVGAAVPRLAALTQA